MSELSGLFRVSIWGCVVIGWSSCLFSSLLGKFVSVWIGCCDSATTLSPIGTCCIRMGSVVLSSFGEFDESKNITYVSGVLIVFCCSSVTMVAFAAFIVFIFLTILSIFYVDLKSIFSLVLIALLLANDDVAMGWGPCVRGLNEIVSMKSVGSLLAMIS